MDARSLVSTGGDQLVATTAPGLFDQVADQRGPETTPTPRLVDEYALQEPESLPRVEVILGEIEIGSSDLAPALVDGKPKPLRPCRSLGDLHGTPPPRLRLGNVGPSATLTHHIGRDLAGRRLKPVQ